MTQILLIFLITLLSKLKFLSSQSDCSQSPCRFGECEQLEFDFRCHCDTGFKGILCDRLLKEDDNLCLSSPCWNGGVCKNIGNDFMCECKPEHTGKNCRLNVQSICLNSNPCKNNGTCIPGLNNEFSCSCVGDFTGIFCEQAVPLCLKKDPCLNGGTCSENICICTSSFTGEFCQKLVSDNTRSNIEELRDKKIVILNKGGYVANLRVDYSLNVNGVLVPVRQTGSILLGQSYAFFIPGNIDLNTEPGVILTVDAYGGVQILRKKIEIDLSCFHVWGTTLNPFWSSIDC